MLPSTVVSHARPARHAVRRALASAAPAPGALALMAACATACASGGGAGGGGGAPVPGANGTTLSTVRVDGGTSSGRYQAQLTHDDYATYADLAVPADRAFAVLPLVYEQLGLKINTAVTESRTVGVNAARTRRVGKDPISRFLSCGADVTGLPIADSYAVTLTVMSRVTASGATGSVLGTQVLGTAQPMSVSGTTVTCQSTGVLEDRIAKTTVLRSAG